MGEEGLCLVFYTMEVSPSLFVMMKKIDMFDAPTGYIATAKECLLADALCTGCAFNKIDEWGAILVTVVVKW